MRTITKTAYKLDELSPKAFERAHKAYAESLQDIPWADELMDSLKGLFKACNGVRLNDWSIGAYSRGNNIRVSFSQDEAGELTGARALAWLENNLFHDLRIPWAGKERWKLAQYGEYYRPGMVKSCPFTGYCGDEDFVEDLKKSVKSGRTLKEAFEGLADEAARILESEDEYQRSEEAFKERAECDDMEFYEDGERV